MAIIEDSTPVIKNTYGTVWVFEFPDGERFAENSPTLATWVLHAPWAHPLWSYYTISLIHLRPVAGITNAIKYAPEAGYEVMVFALDPKYPVMQGEPPHWLQPPNFFGQFEAASDEDAVNYVELRLHEVCDGALSPDTDFRRDWEARFPIGPEDDVSAVVGSVH